MKQHYSLVPTLSVVFRLLLLSVVVTIYFVHSANALDESEIDTLKEAALQGDAAAQYNLGVMYANGEGVPEDDVQAYAWFSIAAAQGDERAKKSKEMLAKRMTRTGIVEAQKLSREYWEVYGPGYATSE